MDGKLKFKPHIDSTVRKAEKMLEFLKLNTKCFMSVKTNTTYCKISLGVVRQFSFRFQTFSYTLLFHLGFSGIAAKTI